MHQALCLTLCFKDRSILKLLMGRRKEKDGAGSVGEEMVVRLPGAKSRRCAGWVFSQGSPGLLHLTSVTCRTEIPERAHGSWALPLH